MASASPDSVSRCLPYCHSVWSWLNRASSSWPGAVAGPHGVGSAGSGEPAPAVLPQRLELAEPGFAFVAGGNDEGLVGQPAQDIEDLDRKSTRLNSSHLGRGEP